MATFLLGILPSYILAQECSVRLLQDRDRLYNNLNVPRDSILEISAGEIKIVTASGHSGEIHDKSGDYIEVYEFSEDQLVMKKIVFGKVGDRIWAEGDNLFDHIGAALLIRGSYVWEVRGEDLAPLNCENRAGYFEKVTQSLYRFVRNDKVELSLERYELYEKMLNDPEKLFELSDHVTVKTDIIRDVDLSTTITEKRSQNESFETIVELEHHSMGQRSVKLTIPASELDSAEELKDASALFYLSDFEHFGDKLEKSPFLYFNLGVAIDKKEPEIFANVYVSLGAGPFWEFGLTSDKQHIEVKKAITGFEIDAGQYGFAKLRAGRFDSENTGILASAYSYDTINKKLFSLDAYLSSEQSCTTCIQSALSLGVQDYRPSLGGYWTSSITYSKRGNFYNKYSNVTFEKPLKKGGKLEFSANYDLSSKREHGVAFSATFPLSYSNKKLVPVYTDMTLRADSGRASKLKEWSAIDRTIYFSNTPETLKRNWKNYMTLDF